MNTNSKGEYLKDNFKSALRRLEEVMAMERTAVIRDSAIQRFECTLDLAWKTLKTSLDETKGVVYTSPKDCIRQAFQQDMLPYDEFWITIVDLRNETVHTYNEKKADQIYDQLRNCITRFKQLEDKLAQEK